MKQNSRYTTFRFFLCALLALVSVYGYSQDTRTLDGSGNNTLNASKGASGTILNNITKVDFADGYSMPSAPDRENPRVISNLLFAQEEIMNNKALLSDYNWVFGLFIDHEIHLIKNADASDLSENLDITPPADDEFFLPNEKILMTRSRYAESTGTEEGNPRRYVNENTAFLDGSAIYGVDEERANWLRSHVDGKLKVSENNLLPWNTTDGKFNSPVDVSAPFMKDETHKLVKYYVAGDTRANKTPLLIGLHTLFVREHNRNCDIIKNNRPDWNDEEIYQHAKRITSGILQSIVYNEWLPAQGISIPPYQGYNELIDPSISNIFSAAAFDMGATFINSNVIRMNNNGDEILGSLSYRDGYYNPDAVWLSGGIEPFLKGMGTQLQQEADCKMIDDIRNFRLGEPGEGGMDIAAININRGRDRGISDYNTVRQDLGLPAINQFSDICADPTVTAKMEQIYGNINNIDPYVGMLAEDHKNNATYGELGITILARQFRMIRDGDRFFYLNDPLLSNSEKEQITNTKLYHVISRNTDIELMQENVFLAMLHENIPNGPDLERLQLNAAIFPNPIINGETNIKVYTERDSELSLQLFDNMGRLIRSATVEITKGDNIIPVNYFNDLPKGAYNFKLENDIGIFTVVKAIK
ncbi:peroxidase family protein [Portibacter lacus]|uniref:T9SS C-terminal target domain-containing protein n=1 Tax=Portibacter lacus TaxID=1099794 RepID=A0AA37WF78_9BACT|nr:peroxidase family protein [Portibacter lacus]GLR16725.1 hypothetical protein GCM10007940_13400 [Portibacter lacus]